MAGERNRQRYKSRMLERARRGEYNDYAIAKVAEPLLKKWFSRTGDLYHIEPEIRKVVSFQFHNLRDPFPRASFDLAFLRSVMMYFDATMKQRVLANVTEALVPGGQLFVGDVDPIRNTAQLSDGVTLEYCGPNVYRKPERATASVTAGS